MKIAMIGNYPPPLCGISVHIKRLVDVLNNEDIEVTVYDVESISESERNFVKIINSKRAWAFGYLFKIKEDVIHIHTHSWKHRAAMTLIARIRRKGIVVTVHSLRAEIEKMGFVDRMMVRYVLKKADRFISVGDKEKKKLVSWGCDAKKIDVIPGFLLPSPDSSAIPGKVRDFMQSHDIVVVANGSGIYFYNDEEIYGIDMLVELCSRFSHEYDVGFIYCISKGYINDMGYFKKMTGLVKEKGMEDKFIFVTDNIEFSSILSQAQVFIRPTNTDGDAVSLREALYLGVPSIASDAAERPDGTVVFKTRDNEDLYQKTADVMQNMAKYQKMLESMKFEDNGKKILDIYRSLI